jgi:hypothetical protein
MAFHIALLRMPLYSDITGRKIVYWFANIGVRDNVSGVSSVGVSEADMGAIDGCGTTDLELDQRNMLGRYRKARSSCGNGE